MKIWQKYKLIWILECMIISFILDLIKIVKMNLLQREKEESFFGNGKIMKKVLNFTVQPLFRNRDF